MIIEIGFKINVINWAACVNINNLIEAFSKMNEFHWIVMIDEIKFYLSNHDLSQLELKCPNVDIHLAINPTSEGYFGQPFNPIFSTEDENTIIEKLKNCHRNSLEIALLLLHLNAYNSITKSLSNEDNLPIHKTCITAESKPLWILAKNQFSKEAILEAIKTELGSLLEDVALLYHQMNESVESWCQRNNWNYIDYRQMTGSEASIVVLFDVHFVIDYLMNECYSRAKKNLFIVQR